jgi:hypothetical protein
VIAGYAQPLPRAGQQRRVDQAVVLAEAHEHAAQRPARRDLGEQVLAPLLEGTVGASCRRRLLVDALHLHPRLVVLLRAGAQVVDQQVGDLLGVGEQCLGVDQRWVSFKA